MASLIATVAASLVGAVEADVSAAIRFTASTGLQRLPIAGAGAYAVDLAMMPAAGLRELLVILEPVDASGADVTAPITIAWTSNGESNEQELTADPVHGVPGIFLFASPAPVAGITALSIVTTAAALVHVLALG